MIAPTRHRKTAPGYGDLGDMKGQIGYIMGNLESIAAQLSDNNTQRQRMEDKIDKIPNIIRDSMKTLAETTKDHDARIALLEKSSASDQGSMSMRTKVYGIIVGLFGVCGTGVAVWEAFHPIK